MRLTKEGRKRLATILCVREITHRELAQAVGWKSHGMVAHLLSGRRSGVEPASAVAIAKKLGVDVSDLFVTEIPAMDCQRKRGTAA